MKKGHEIHPSDALLSIYDNIANTGLRKPTPEQAEVCSSLGSCTSLAARH